MSDVENNPGRHKRRELPKPSVVDIDLTDPYRIGYVDRARLGIVRTGKSGKYSGKDRAAFWIVDMNTREVVYGPYDRLKAAHVAFDKLTSADGGLGNVQRRLATLLLS